MKYSGCHVAVMPDPDLERRLANLSPEKRALVARKLARSHRSGTLAPRTPGVDPPASFSQRRLWFLDQMEPGNPAYNVFRAVILRGPLNVEALEHSLTEILQRHEILRTRFPEKDGEPIQRVGDPETISLPVEEFSNVPREQRRAMAENIAGEEAANPFDLGKDLLLKARLLRFAKDEHILVLVLHHIAVDGWSVGIFFRELVSLYDSFSRGRGPALPALPVQFGDYAAWERSQWSAEKQRDLLRYWTAELAAVPAVLNLPINRPRPAVLTSEGSRYYFQISDFPLGELKSLARQHSATLYMALLAAFQALLARYSGQNRFAVGSPMACRELPELESLIGCFSNTLALKADLSGNPSFRELLCRIRETVVGALAHEMLPFDMLVEALHPKRDPSRMALVQVNFRLLTAPLPPSSGGGLKFEFLEVDNHRCKFDLALELVEKEDGLTGYLEYNTDLFYPATMPMIASDYEDLLLAAIASPDTPLEDLAFDPRFGGVKLGASPAEVHRKPAYLRPSASIPAANPWTSAKRARPNSKMRLFCLPYAGGDAMSFLSWSDRLPEFIELFPILLPGRGSRISEPPYRTIASLVEAMAQGLQPFLDKDFALLGISTGAILAFELSRVLRERQGMTPIHLFACCCEAPHLPTARGQSIYNLPEAEFLEKVREFGGTPGSALDDPELRELILPALRADFELRDTYAFTPADPLACPVTAIGGLEDVHATAATLEAWRNHTGGDFEIDMLPGGHFFFSPDPSPLLAIVEKRLRASRMQSATQGGRS